MNKIKILVKLTPSMSGLLVGIFLLSAPIAGYCKNSKINIAKNRKILTIKNVTSKEPTYKSGYKVYHNLDHDGIYIVRKLNTDDCIVSTFFDVPVFLKNISDLKNVNMIDDLKDDKNYKDRKNSLMESAAQHLSPLIIKMIFSEISPEICSFSFGYLSKDKAGKDFSINFNSFVMFKSTYEHINWSKFDSTQLPFVVSLYYLADWFSNDVLKEEQGFWK